MKDRDYKIFRAGEYYHIFNRGANKQAIFIDDQDYLNFLKRLKLVMGLWQSVKLNIKPLPIGAFSILSFCLMLNHFHFLIRQNTDLGIQNLISKLCTGFSMYFNRRHERIGPLFQDTFRAKLVDNDSYAMYLSAYIHNNPAKPLEYPYSSLPDIVGNRNGTITDKKLLLGWFNNDSEAYKNFVLGFNQSDQQIIDHLLFEDEEDKEG